MRIVIPCTTFFSGDSMLIIDDSIEADKLLLEVATYEDEHRKTLTYRESFSFDKKELETFIDCLVFIENSKNKENKMTKEVKQFIDEIEEKQCEKIKQVKAISKIELSFFYVLAVELYNMQIDLGKEPSPELEEIISVCKGGFHEK